MHDFLGKVMFSLAKSFCWVGKNLFFVGNVIFGGQGHFLGGQGLFDLAHQKNDLTHEKMTLPTEKKKLCPPYLRPSPTKIWWTMSLFGGQCLFLLAKPFFCGQSHFWVGNFFGRQSHVSGVQCYFLVSKVILRGQSHFLVGKVGGWARTWSYRSRV